MPSHYMQYYYTNNTNLMIGIMTHLEDYYKGLTNSTIKTYLCTGLDHFCASYGDKGWGCGYRNFQMMLSSLAMNPTYSKVLFNGKLSAVFKTRPKLK